MDYLGQVQSAVEFIESDLTAGITFVDVARAAGFSPFHFHRIFLSIVGESVTDYIRKRRLTLAAAELLAGRGRRVIDLALDYRFGSDASFTRAFRQAYGLTPGQYRKLGKPLVLLERHRLTANLLRQLADASEPRRVELPALTVVGLHYQGTNDREQIPALWREFARRASEITGAACPGTSLGVCAPVERMTAESEVSYLACIQVQPGSGVPSGMVRQTLAPQTYLLFTHRGPAEGLEDTYRYIYGTYLPHTGLQRSEAPDFELYDRRFRPDAADSEMEIYIPLEP